MEIGSILANNILYCEVNLVCVVILILLLVKISKSVFLQEQRQLLAKVVVVNILFLLVDAMWIFVNSRMLESTVSLNWILNGAYYILSGILGFFWFAYSETVQESKFARDKRYKIIGAIPVAVLIILTIVSFKTGWLFYIDDLNVYHRGPLYAYQLFASFGYVVLTATKAFYLSFKTDDYRRKTELQTLAVFVLPSLLAGTIQVFFPGFPILCVANTFGILYVYLTLQEQLISQDALTRLNNRNQLLQFLSTKLKHRHDDKELYLLMMDIDYFKMINDKHGHIEGDRALKLVANSLMTVCQNHNYFISRYGGDEFIVICEVDNEQPVKTLCTTLQGVLKNIATPYKLSVSIGYAKYTNDMKSQQDFIDKADKELYKIKEAR